MSATVLARAVLMTDAVLEPIGTHGMHHFLPIRHRVFDLRFIKEWTLIFITYDTT